MNPPPDQMPTPERACQAPLIESLKSVPSDARTWVEVEPGHDRNIPFGRYCHESAAEIERLTAERDEAERSRTLNHAAATMALDQRDTAIRERDEARSFNGLHPNIAARFIAKLGTRHNEFLEESINRVVAERDAALAQVANLTANLAHADEKIDELQDYIRDTAPTPSQPPAITEEDRMEELQRTSANRES